VSEFLVLVGTYTRYPIAAIIGTLGIVLAALYILIPVQKALHGPMVSGNEDLKDLNIREKIAISPVIIVIVIMGFYPKPVLDLINPTAEKIVTSAGYSDPVAKVDK
jgi:NADH-quinone oxidoreductase subunit M